MQWKDKEAPKGTVFEVTDDHLRLLQGMAVQWQWDEYGAPEINPKRPYGNSSVARDICEILHWDCDEGEEPTEYLRDDAYKIHSEMLWVIQIFFQLQRITVGRFCQNDEYGYKWSQLP